MKVIIAIDQSVYWKQVIDSVLHSQWQEDTAFDVLTVLEPLPWQGIRLLPLNQEMMIELNQKRDAAALELLSEARQQIQTGVGNCSVHVELRHGSARDEIIKAAVDWMADKIVLGAHGEAANRLFSGSVPGSVTQHAHCTVQLVRLVEVKDIDKEKKEELEKAFAKTYIY